MQPEPKPTLADLGWSAHFLSQLDIDEIGRETPVRVTSVHRDRIAGLGETGALELHLAPGMFTGEVAVGDWVLCRAETGRITRILGRKSLLSRRAAGEDARTQLIAANVDTLFITTSMNADFNPARLERYLALAHTATVTPVIVLTKADTCADPAPYHRDLAGFAPGIPVVALDARDPEAAAALHDWTGRGQTTAFLGSSGVGKSTLIAALSGLDLDTGAIREADARGRHTTTERAMYRTHGGGWVIDTPGMRALRLHDVGEGIDTVFADLAELATRCRFNDCAHQSEPGCAVRAAIDAGDVSAERLARWDKLKREDARNVETIAQARKRAKSFGKMVKSAVRTKKKR